MKPAALIQLMETQNVYHHIDLLCEASWEVCNKVGGIYTVLSTKALELQKRLGDRLVFIGPDFGPEASASYFDEDPALAESLQVQMGLKVRSGRWKVPGAPLAVLVDFRPVMKELPEIYGKIWQQYQVDSLHAYGDYDESCAFAVASALVMMAIAKSRGAADSRCIGHFNEWTTGMGLLYLQMNRPQWATVFTTHATSIGRSICGNGKDLYRYFQGYNGDQMAVELNMQSKHSLEKKAAHAADCFTAVSDLTAHECEQLLGLRPAVVTPNGFDASFVPSAAKRGAQRRAGRKKLLAMASGLSGHRIPEDAFIVATSGRNEYRNKGLDLFIDTMASVNTDPKMKERHVAAFILVPAWVKDAAPDMLTEATEKPQYVTHRLHNEDCDAVACRLRSLNPDSDRLTVCYLPCYLDGADGMLDIPYYSLLPAIDLTIFPSYYEPWGYTPLESVAFGVPTVTTDKSGFGCWVIEDEGSDMMKSGVKVEPRDDEHYSRAAAGIEETVAKVALMSDAERRKLKQAAHRTAEKASWSLFIKHYDEAFSTALLRAGTRNGQRRL